MNQVKTINELINRTWRARTGDGARAHSVCLSVRNDDRTLARGGHRRRGGKVSAWRRFRRQCQRRAGKSYGLLFSNIFKALRFLRCRRKV